MCICICMYIYIYIYNSGGLERESAVRELRADDTAHLELHVVRVPGDRAGQIHVNINNFNNWLFGGQC